jgi:flagellar biosynthesis protein FliR
VGFPATIIIGLTAFVLIMPLIAPFLENSLQRGLGLAFSFGK